MAKVKTSRAPRPARRVAPADQPPTRGRQLLAEAIETDDDAIRIVYADWLEEQGDPAAQVIRLSCQIAATEEARHKPLLAQLATAITNHRDKWIDPIAGWCTPVGDGPLFERGMYARFYGTAGKYAQKASQQALLEASTRFGVRESMLRGKATRVAACETLAWTQELWWWDCQLDDDGMSALASSPHVRPLRRLTLEKVRCTNAGVRALGNEQALGKLQHLGLRAPVYYSKWDEAAVLDVVERLPLESLDLSGLNHVNPRVLGDAPVVAKLRSLDLHVSRLADFAGARQLTNLTELRIQSLRTEPGDVEALLDNPTFAKLSRLQLDTYTTKLPEPLMKRIAARFETTPWSRR